MPRGLASEQEEPHSPGTGQEQRGPSLATAPPRTRSGGGRTEGKSLPLCAAWTHNSRPGIPCAQRDAGTFPERAVETPVMSVQGMERTQHEGKGSVSLSRPLPTPALSTFPSASSLCLSLSVSLTYTHTHTHTHTHTTSGSKDRWSPQNKEKQRNQSVPHAASNRHTLSLTANHPR